MTMQQAAALAPVAVLALVVYLVDSFALRDLAATPDHQLRRFDRRTWALLILFLFPVGPLLYLTAGKGGPRRHP